MIWERELRDLIWFAGDDGDLRKASYELSLPQPVIDLNGITYFGPSGRGTSVNPPAGTMVLEVILDRHPQLYLLVKQGTVCSCSALFTISGYNLF
jgi:hypothetical protein